MTLLLDNCSMNGFGTRKIFWPMLVVGCGWLLLIAAALWMGAVISWCSLDACCYFLVPSGWLLLIPGALCMLAVISWCSLDACCYFLVLLIPGVLWMLAVISWCSLNE